MKLSTLTIRYKAAFIFASMLIIFSSLTIVINYNITYKTGIQNNRDLGWSIAVNTAPHLAHHLYINDIIGTHRTLKVTVNNNADIVYAFLLDEKGKIVAHTFGEKFPIDLLSINTEGKQKIEIIDAGNYTISDFAYPLEHGLLGTLRIGISDQRLKNQLWNNILISLLILLISIGLAVVSAILVSKIITNPLERLTVSAQKVAKGNFDELVEIHSKDEIGVLGNAFNAMANDLKTLNKNLNKNVSQLELELNKRKIAEKRLSDSIVKLEISKDKAEESNRFIKQILKNMVHEVRTPLNGVLGFSSILTDQDDLTEETKYLAHRIIDSGTRLNKVINDILEISLLESKTREIRLKPFNILQTLKEHAEKFTTKAEEKGLLFEFNCKNAPNSNIISDQDAVNNVLDHLLNNAVKFTSSGYIKLSCDFQKYFIHFRVIDSGIGIASKDITKIFEPFYQLNPEKNKIFEGLGIGLSIAKKNARLLGGHIVVESTPKQGSTFTFILPLNTESTANYADTPELILKKPRAEINFKNSLLIAENEEINYEYMRTILPIMGFKLNIIHAWNGKEAIELCKKNKAIQLVLMDIKMPEINGIEASKQIKQVNPKIKIIIQSAFDDEENRSLAKEAGCDLFVSKPVTKETLSKLIQEYLS